jgi:hypothetical protein
MHGIRFIAPQALKSDGVEAQRSQQHQRIGARRSRCCAVVTIGCSMCLDIGYQGIIPQCVWKPIINA